MTQHSDDTETSKSEALDSSLSGTQSQRIVARTLLDANSPELKKIRKLLHIESPEKGRKVAKTLLDADVPKIEKIRSERTVAKTMLEPKVPAIEKLEPQQEKALAEPNTESQSNAKTKRVVEKNRQFVAKTMLDHEVLSNTLNKYAARKSELAEQEARERASQPAVQFHSVDSKKLAQPCAWSWNDDPSTDRFRYCPTCQTQVYNFDGLELPEAEALIFSRENKRNRTLYKRADGKFMTQDCPVQVNRKKKFVLFSVVAASGFLALLVMVISALSPASRPESATVDVTEEQAETSRASGGEADGATTAQDADVGVQKNADGTRKRPTFGPEDVQSYWE